MSNEQRPSKAAGVDDLGFSPFRGDKGPTFPRQPERAAGSAHTPDRHDEAPGRAHESGDGQAPTGSTADRGHQQPERAERAASVPGPSAPSAARMDQRDEKVTETTVVRPAVSAPVATGATAGAAETAPRPPRKPASRRTRKARLRLTRVDPWSVMKVSFLFSIAFGIMMWVSTYVVWNVVESSGMFTSINDTVNNVLGTGQSNFRLEDFVNQSRVLGFTALLAAVDIVLFTAIATLFSFLYNLAASVLGGLEVTLAED